MANDWDLHAVVRGFTSTTTTTTSAAAVSTISCGHPCNTFQQDYNVSPCWFQDLFEPRKETITEDLHDLYKPFFSQKTVISQETLPMRNSPLSVLGDLSHEKKLQQQVAKQKPFSVFNGTKSISSHTPSSRSSKKRKNHMKKVSHVPAESLSSDPWSWRKYGQKPIKGSPYPRGYYRCSTSKGCMARKQVERNKSDPGMFIVTYTGGHNHPMPTHRNSLAGSTRPKPPDIIPSTGDPKKSSSSPESSAAPEKLITSPEDFQDNDNDFFEGLEDFAGQDGGGDCLSDDFPSDLDLDWLATATTGGGG